MYANPMLMLAPPHHCLGKCTPGIREFGCNVPGMGWCWAREVASLMTLNLCGLGMVGDKRRGRTRQHTTGVSFGARGDRVVASYHGDHAYSFDITRNSCEAAHSPVAYAPSQAAPCSSKSAAPNSQPQNCSTSGREDFRHTVSRTPSSE